MAISDALNASVISPGRPLHVVPQKQMSDMQSNSDRLAHAANTMGHCLHDVISKVRDFGDHEAELAPVDG